MQNAWKTQNPECEMHRPRNIGRRKGKKIKVDFWQLGSAVPKSPEHDTSTCTDRSDVANAANFGEGVAATVNF